MSIHDEAKRICEGLGTSYQWPGDDAVRTVFAAYLALREQSLFFGAVASALGSERLQDEAADDAVCRVICERDYARRERDELSTQVETLTKRNAELATQIVEADTATAELRAQVEALTRERDDERVRKASCCDQMEKERDAAKADAARLREALTKYMDEFMIHGERGHPSPDLQKAGTSALAATDSGEWLAKHDAEVALRVRDEVVRLFRVAYDGPCVRGEKIVASRTVDQLLRGVE